MSGQAENESDLARPEAGRAAMQRTQKLLAAGGVLGALAASSCCLLPLAFFGLGVSGAWLGHLTRLAPYQPCFIAGTVACLGAGYRLRYRSRKAMCVAGQACTRQLPDWLVTAGFIAATVLVAAAMVLDLLAPLFL